MSAATNWWLGYWADNAQGSGNDDDAARADTNSTSSGTGSGGGGNLPSSLGLGVYAGLSCFSIVVSFFAVLASTLAGQRACKHFHDAMARGVLRAPMAFFDTTPLGRVVNR